MKVMTKKTGGGCIPSLIALAVIVLAMGLFGCSSDLGNKSPDEKSIKSDLEYGLRNYLLTTKKKFHSESSVTPGISLTHEG